MAKTASLVFHCFGEDSYINRLAQETVPVHHALTGYDKTVLLRHETDIGKFELSEKAEKKATVLDIPTPANLAKYLNELGDEGYVVDLYIFSHGWSDRFRASKGTYGDNTSISGTWLEANVNPLKLRMVWGTNCYGETLSDTWAKLGARSSSGSRFVNFYPTRFTRFVKAWNSGATFEEAAAGSSTAIQRTGVHLYLIFDAMAQLKKWNGKIWQAPTVLGKTAAAERYISECWGAENFVPGKSGKQSINHASEIVIAGDAKVTKDTVW